jgi:Domain of unknown function (DUF4349)
MAADPIDERYDEIVRGLRALPGAPAELRGRVLELAAVADTPRPPRRGLKLAVVMALLIAALVAAIALSSGGSNSKSSSSRGSLGARSAAAPKRAAGEKALTTETHSAELAPTNRPFRRAGSRDSAALPITPGRLTEVHASLRLRVPSVDRLSQATARAMRITRSLGGFVQSVDYGTPSGGNGDAYLTVRIPVGNVQKAVSRFTALGSIQSQHLSIRDLQNQANAEELRILQLRQLAAQLRAKLAGSLTPEERVAVQARLDAVHGLLRAKTGQHAGTLRQGRLSTFELELTTRKGAAAAPSHPGRIGRAARHAFSALSKTIAGLLYVLIVLSPLLVLAAAVLWGARYRRRRVEQRLLARA